MSFCKLSRTSPERWQVDYKDRELDASHIEPGWHAWISYLVDKPPTEDKIMALGVRPWESKEPKINMTLSRAAYRPYSTYAKNPTSVLTTADRHSTEPSRNTMLGNLLPNQETARHPLHEEPFDNAASWSPGHENDVITSNHCTDACMRSFERFQPGEKQLSLYCRMGISDAPHFPTLPTPSTCVSCLLCSLINPCRSQLCPNLI